MKIIKGCPRDKWEEVQAIQHEPFIFIQSNGSKWAGQEPDDVSVLLDVLSRYALDPRFEECGGFITVNPCIGIRDPDNYGKWIDGPRFYAVEPTARYFGNFYALSHVFTIDTNDAPTIEALNAAIRANQATEAYAQAKRECAEPPRQARIARRGR